MYDWVTMQYSRNGHNTVNQLYADLKKTYNGKESEKIKSFFYKNGTSSPLSDITKR